MLWHSEVQICQFRPVNPAPIGRRRYIRAMVFQRIDEVLILALLASYHAFGSAEVYIFVKYEIPTYLSVLSYCKKTREQFMAVYLSPQPLWKRNIAAILPQRLKGNV